jgi:hypothetical protein
VLCWWWWSGRGRTAIGWSAWLSSVSEDRWEVECYSSRRWTMMHGIEWPIADLLVVSGCVGRGSFLPPQLGLGTPRPFRIPHPASAFVHSNIFNHNIFIFQSSKHGSGGRHVCRRPGRLAQTQAAPCLGPASFIVQTCFYRQFAAYLQEEGPVRRAA